MSSLLHRRLPEFVTVIAAAGIAWTLLSRPPKPPDGLRCGTYFARPDCFLPVPGGTPRLGAQADDPSGPRFDPYALVNESPVRVARVAPFWLQRTEATVGTWRSCVRGGACSEHEVALDGGFSTAYPAAAPDDALRDAQPLNSVTWDGASTLCAWLGGRLPTEAEWEHAARAGDGRRWPWGDVPRCPVLPEDAGFARTDFWADTTCRQQGPLRADAVAEPNPLGFIGMAGNLWEWTAEPYGDHGARTQRGGSWLATSPADVRVSVRGGMSPNARVNDVGVRCAFGG